MKKLCFGWLLAVLLCISACSMPQGDYFAPFAGGYRAQLRGKLHSLELEGLLELSAPTSTGERAAAFTFYAPQTLQGTTLLRGEGGEILLCSGEVRVDGSAYAPLLDAFVYTGKIDAITPEGGRTRLSGEGFVLELLTDGTPIAVEHGALCAEILHFEQVQ